MAPMKKPGPSTKRRPTTNAARVIDTGKDREAALQVLSEVADRMNLAGALGMSFSGKRDLYQALGYPREIRFKDYWGRYRRQDIAKAVVNRPVRASWRKRPRVTESGDTETPFEKAWKDLAKQHKVWSYFSRADRLARVGRYSVIFLGLDDGQGIETPALKASKLLYLSVFSEGNAKITKYVESTTDERYGLPEIYSLNLKAGATARATPVHWSRVIHVAEDLLEDPVDGIPQLEAIWNRLQDIELLSGGSAEMFWRGAFPGTAFNQMPGTTIDPTKVAQFERQIEEYIHGFRRSLLLSGIDPKELAQQIADPSSHVSIQIDLISAATGIPKRILLGSERGELASGQDDDNWARQIEERQADHCEPTLLRQFIDRLVDFGVLPAPAGEYEVQWEPIVTQGPRESAEIAQLKASALAAYASAPGATEILPEKPFYQLILGLKPEEIEEIENIQNGMVEDGSSGDLSPTDPSLEEGQADQSQEAVGTRRRGAVGATAQRE